MVPAPGTKSPQARLVNRIARNFGSRARLLYIDWKSLQLDEKLKWPVSRTLEFIYLDSATESHRDLRAVITHHIDVTTDPVQRYWAIVALKMMTSVYGDACAALARRVERELRIDLPYLTLKRGRMPEVVSDPELDAVRLEGGALDAEAVGSARTAIERIAAAARARNERMLESARRRHYPEVAREELAATA